MAWVGLGIAAVALLAGSKVLWMLRQPEDSRYREPGDDSPWFRTVLLAPLPVIALVTGHWLLAIVLVVFGGTLFWLAKRSRDYVRYRQQHRP